jgi:hypothetical protein
LHYTNGILSSSFEYEKIQTLNRLTWKVSEKSLIEKLSLNTSKYFFFLKILNKDRDKIFLQIKLVELNW